MPVDTFTREDFEKALPVHKDTKEPLWKPLGVVQGEFAYLIAVRGPVAVLVRSSVGSGGVSAGCGEDSIRCLLVDARDLKPMGSKLQKWTTRVPGWRERLAEQLRELYRLGKRVGGCPNGCLSVNAPKLLRVFKVKKEGPNKGRLFLKCDGCTYFEWVS